MEVKRGEVADTLLTLLNFWASNGCLLKNPERHLIWLFAVREIHKSFETQ
jgi:hypothetical protein